MWVIAVRRLEETGDTLRQIANADHSLAQLRDQYQPDCWIITHGYDYVDDVRCWSSERPGAGSGSGAGPGPGPGGSLGRAADFNGPTHVEVEGAFHS